MKGLPYYCSIVFALALLASIKAALPEDENDRALSDSSPTIEGGWRWNFVMPDGSSVRPKLTLAFDNGQLTGTTSFRPGTEAPITNAVLKGNLLTFQVVRQREGQAFVTSYSGRWSGTNLTGKIVSNWAGENQSFDWRAHRAHLGVEGVWSWTNSIGPRGGRGAGRGGRPGGENVTRVLLEQDGEKVTGKTLSRFSRPVRITHGSITNNELSFVIERSYREYKSVSTYTGKQTGDTIVGTVEVDANGRVRKGTWEAKRVD